MEIELFDPADQEGFALDFESIYFDEADLVDNHQIAHTTSKQQTETEGNILSVRKILEKITVHLRVLPTA